MYCGTGPVIRCSVSLVRSMIIDHHRPQLTMRPGQTDVLNGLPAQTRALQYCCYVCCTHARYSEPRPVVHLLQPCSLSFS